MCDKKSEGKCKYKEEACVAISVLCPDWPCFYKMVAGFLIKCIGKKMCKDKGQCCKEKEKCCKGEEKCCKEEQKCCKGEKKCCESKDKCCEGKDKCCDEKACDPMKCFQKMCKCLFGDHKDKIKEKIDIALQVLKEELGIEPKDSFFGKPHIAKDIAKMLFEFHEKCEGCCGECPDKAKECFIKFANKFWDRDMEEHMKKRRKIAKKIAKKVVAYCPCQCDEVCKKVAQKCLARMVFRKINCSIQAVIAENKKKPDEDKYCCPKECKKEKCCKLKCLKYEALQFAVAMLKEKGEGIQKVVAVAKETVEEYAKDKPCLKDKCKEKLIIHASRAACFKTSCCEKAAPEEVKKIILHFLTNVVVPCPKKCVEKCKKVFKMGLRFHGVQDKLVISIAAHWGAKVCCRANFKTGCPKHVVVPFAKKWIADSVGAVTEAIATFNELAKDCQGCACNFCKKKKMKKCLGKFLNWEGKWDKEAFKAFYAKMQEKMKVMHEKMKGSCEKCEKK